MSAPASFLSHELRKDDVILGRGNDVQCHPGNQRFRIMVARFAPDYSRAHTKPAKDAIADRLTDNITINGARFVRRAAVSTEDEVRWEAVTGQFISTKVRQAMRDTLKLRCRRNKTKLDLKKIRAGEAEPIWARRPPKARHPMRSAVGSQRQTLPFGVADTRHATANLYMNAYDQARNRRSAVSHPGIYLLPHQQMIQPMQASYPVLTPILLWQTQNRLRQYFNPGNYINPYLHQHAGTTERIEQKPIGASPPNSCVAGVSPPNSCVAGERQGTPQLHIDYWLEPSEESHVTPQSSPTAPVEQASADLHNHQRLPPVSSFADHRQPPVVSSFSPREAPNQSPTPLESKSHDAYTLQQITSAVLGHSTEE